jgi:hypothetical protein
MSSSSGSLPRHYYVWVDSSFLREHGTGYEPAVWFGLHSHPGRAWGCHVMLECGAFYRGLPPHSIAFSPDPACADWALPQAQVWDCYGRDFSLLIYDYLDGLRVKVKGGEAGEYLFTAVPQGDAFTHDPQPRERVHVHPHHWGQADHRANEQPVVRGAQLHR